MGLGDGSEARYHHLGTMYLLPFAGAGREIANAARRAFSRFSLR
jgi:hypothetical protein